MDGNAFRDLLVETKHRMFPQWSSERLTWNPIEALRYCAVMRFNVGVPDLEDEFFLRWLTNFRKGGYEEAA